MKVGSIHVHPVHDGLLRLPARDILRSTNTDGDPFAPHARFFDAEGVLDLSIGGFLVVLGDRIVLVDCGVGPIERPNLTGGAFLDSLTALGYAPDQVTDVVFTHLHFDHVGWATQQGRIVFPNATYRCHRADWAHFLESDPDGIGRKLQPVVDRMEFWETDGTVLPGLDVQGAPGHTPGSTIMVVSDGGERAMLLGDVVHCPLELVEDDWQAVFDVDPALAQRTRIALARELEGTDIPIAAAHFPGLQFGRLLSVEGRRGWTY